MSAEYTRLYKIEAYHNVPLKIRRKKEFSRLSVKAEI